VNIIALSTKTSKNSDNKIDKELLKYRKICEKIENDNPWKEIDFVLDIEPEPYARPRKSRKLELAGKANVFYNPREKYKRKLKKEIESKIKGTIKDFQLIGGEVHLKAEIGLMPPKKYTESKTKWKLVNDRIITPIVRPDIDNWVKPIMDVLNKLAYEDDGLITDLHAIKVYSILDHPYIHIWIRYRQAPITLR